MKNLRQNGLVALMVAMLMTLTIACSEDEASKVVDPTAEFEFEIDGMSVSFMSTVTDAVSFTWDFGDGGTSDVANPDYTYTEGGEYTVTLTVTGEEGSTPAVVSETITVTAPQAKLAGTIIGHEGSWDGVNGLIEAAFDGDFATYVDAPSEFASTGYVGYDLGAGNEAIVTGFAFAPRDGWTARVVGAEIRGSNDADFLNTYDVLHTISEEGPLNELTSVSITSETSYRFIYYYTAADGYCNVSELEFYGE